MEMNACAKCKRGWLYGLGAVFHVLAAFWEKQRYQTEDIERRAIDLDDERLLPW